MSLGKQAGPRTVLVAVMVVGILVVVVPMAKVDVAKDVAVLVKVSVRVVSSVFVPSQQQIGRPFASPHG